MSRNRLWWSRGDIAGWSYGSGSWWWSWRGCCSCRLKSSCCSFGFCAGPIDLSLDPGLSFLLGPLGLGLGFSECLSGLDSFQLSLRSGFGLYFRLGLRLLLSGSCGSCVLLCLQGSLLGCSRFSLRVGPGLFFTHLGSFCFRLDLKLSCFGCLRFRLRLCLSLCLNLCLGLGFSLG